MPPFDSKPDSKAPPPKAIPDDRIEDVARAMVAAHPSGQNVPTEVLDPAPLMNSAREFVAAFNACTEIAKNPKPKQADDLPSAKAAEQVASKPLPPIASPPVFTPTPPVTSPAA